jgi:hypothetical protein
MVVINFFKTLLLLLTAATPLVCDAQINSQKRYSSLSRDGIKGKVSVAETSSYTIDTANRLVRQDSCCISRTEYDKNGNSVKLERFRLGGIYQGGTVTTYHPNGLIKKLPVNFFLLIKMDIIQAGKDTMKVSCCVHLRLLLKMNMASGQNLHGIHLMAKFTEKKYILTKKTEK